MEQSIRRIKELLVAKSKTQSDLARALNRDKSAVTHLLRGKRQLKASEISIIATFLGVSEATLLGLESREASPKSLPAADRLEDASSVTFAPAPERISTTSYASIKPEQTHFDAPFLFQVEDHSLDLNGILPGDEVMCDPRLKAERGQVVVVRVTTDEATPKLVLRQYQPPFLETQSTRDGFERLHEERAYVEIIAPVTQLVRHYSSS